MLMGTMCRVRVRRNTPQLQIMMPIATPSPAILSPDPRPARWQTLIKYTPGGVPLRRVDGGGGFVVTMIDEYYIPPGRRVVQHQSQSPIFERLHGSATGLWSVVRVCGVWEKFVLLYQRIFKGL
eukprot:scaffold35403_cov67-Cyclotella_meneghiniana.AAC.6